MNWWRFRQWRGRRHTGRPGSTGQEWFREPALHGALFAFLVLLGYSWLQHTVSTSKVSEIHPQEPSLTEAHVAEKGDLPVIEEEIIPRPIWPVPEDAGVDQPDRKRFRVAPSTGLTEQQVIPKPPPAPAERLHIPMRRPQSKTLLTPPVAEKTMTRFRLAGLEAAEPYYPLHRVSRKRMILAQAVTLGGSFMVYRKFQQYFGGVAQPFRIGSDWTKDNAMYFDELLHFQGSYRLAQALGQAYHWAGLQSTKAEIAGALVAATTMTFLEYIDGRRPNDEASYSDFTANFLGITFALLKPRVPLLEKIDFHVSYRDFRDPLTAKKLLDYDRITHWMTYDLSDRFAFPMEVGIGYGVRNAFKKDVRPHLRIGVGVGLAKLMRLKNSRLAKPLQWLDVYQLGVHVQVL